MDKIIRQQSSVFSLWEKKESEGSNIPLPLDATVEAGEEPRTCCTTGRDGESRQ